MKLEIVCLVFLLTVVLAKEYDYGDYEEDVDDDDDRELFKKRDGNDDTIFTDISVKEVDWHNRSIFDRPYCSMVCNNRTHTLCDRFKGDEVSTTNEIKFLKTYLKILL